MRKILVVLDFDGTFTILEMEAAHFCEMFLERLRKRIGMSVASFEELVEEQRRIMQASPDRHGWVHNGILVAGLVDHYIVVNAIAHRMFTVTGAIPREEDQIVEVQSYFHDLIPQIESVFKPDAFEVFREIMGRYPETCCIVTNSRTELAQGKLHRLIGHHAELAPLIGRVQGSAKKYVVDPTFDEIHPVTITIPGLARPIHVRRPVYYGTINRFRVAHDLFWEETAVFGDIAELDLMMPHALGATVGLMDHGLVPGYEREYFRTHPRGHVLNNPTEILSVLDSM